MARRAESSASRSMASRRSWEQAPPEDAVFGKETGLPLIRCTLCGRARIIELRAVTNENGNQGRVFFKCPRNIRGMPGRCTFYEFQKEYLKVLVEEKYVFIDLEAALGEVGREVSCPFNEEKQQTKIEEKGGNKSSMDSMISMMKLLIFFMFVLSIIGLLNLVK